MTVLPHIGYSLYQLFLMFVFWSFIGWTIEVIDMTYETGEYQNRGFLNMPICPIEGLGVIMVVIFFRPIEDTILPLFIASTVLCTAFELSVGLLMEKLFHARWWDYSHMKFNFLGLICLRNSLFFGFGCVVCVRYAQPLVLKAIDRLPVKVGLVFTFVMVFLIVLDTTISLATVKRLKLKVKRMDEIGRLMLSGSEKVGMKLADGTLRVKSKIDPSVEKAAELVGTIQEKGQEKQEKLRAEYEKLMSEKDEMVDRLLRAFPNMKSFNHSVGLSFLKKRLGIRSDDMISELDEENDTFAVNKSDDK